MDLVLRPVDDDALVEVIPLFVVVDRRGFGMELMSELRFGYLLGLHARAGLAKGTDALGKTTGYPRVGRSF